MRDETSVVEDKANAAAAADDTQSRDKKEQPFRLRSARVPLPDKSYRRMSKKQLADVVRTQLMQQMTNNPMDQDFYSQVYTARKGEAWQGMGFPGEESSRGRLFRNEDGTPRLGDGVLGRIQSSTASKPRTMLSISTDVDSGCSGMFPTCTIPFLIEEGIRCIMDMEDVDGLILSEESSEELVAHRQALDQKLLMYLGITDENWSVQDPDHLVYMFLHLTKGRVLVFRALLLLSKQYAMRLVCVILGDFKPVCLPESPSLTDSRGGEAICQLLYSCQPEEIAYAMERILSPANLACMVDILRSKAGAAVFESFFKAGHQLRRSPDSPQEMVLRWLDVYSRVLDSIMYRPSAMLADVPTLHEYVGAAPELLWENTFHMCMHGNGQQLEYMSQDSDLRMLSGISRGTYESAAFVFDKLFAVPQQQ